MRFVSLCLALASLAPAQSRVPARWPADAATLPLLRDSPINCLLVPAAALTPAFRAAAGSRQVLAVFTREEDAIAALKAGADGLVLEGTLPPVATARLRALTRHWIEVRPRADLDFAASPIVTAQALWPGVRAQDDDGKAAAGPTGAPWIDTNAGFLRFARALAREDAEVWLANRPPAQTAITAERYLQAIADAAMVGAHWVLSLDDAFLARLLSGDAKTRAAWQRINQLLAFYQTHAGWRSLPAYGQLAVVQDQASGGLLSGGILDMIAVKHTPLIAVPRASLSKADLSRVKMTVNVDTAGMDEAQKQKLRDFARAGGTLLSGPPGWRMPPPSATEITLAKTEIAKLDDIWREVNSLMGRRNLGVRLFNVSSMLSSVTGAADGSRVVLHLVNYSDYPVDSIAVHLLGKFAKAKLWMPEAASPKELTPYDNEDGSGVDIDTVATVAVLELHR